MRLLIATLFAFILFVPRISDAQIVLDTSSTGLKYKMFTHEKGPKAQIGDFIKFKFILYSDKDSILVNNFKSIIPVTTPVRKPTYKGDLEDAFMMMAKGDSGIFLVSADSFYNGQDMPVNSGTMLKIMIKMLDVETPEAHARRMANEKAAFKKMSAQKTKEAQNNLDQYIKKNVPNAIKTADGLYYIIEKQGTGLHPKAGQTVVIHYTAKLLDGKVVESDSGNTQSFVMGQHKVISGLEKGIALLKKGSKARFYIPSPLAYKNRGKEDLIQPFASLIYDVQVEDIK